MTKEGKVDLLSVLILTILIFAVYAVFVLGGDTGLIGVYSQFPVNETNASASRGFASGVLPSMSAFNGTTALFQCNVTANSTNANITNVSLYINTSPIKHASQQAVKDANQTIRVNDSFAAAGNIIKINFSVVKTFNEGTYYWVCRADGNQSSLTPGNTTLNRTFIIDKTVPGFTTNVSNTSKTKVSTEDRVAVQVNASDQLTSIKGAILFVNTSGTASNQVNVTTVISNNTQLNLSFKIPGFALGGVLNFTIQVNDSVNNVNLTPAVLFTIDGDATGPGITLNKPADKFNQSTATAPNFNFTARDNNNSLTFNLVCGINISLGNSKTTISPITATNGTPQVNTTSTTLSNGTYTWNVSCTDPAGNSNTSLSKTFTVDQIPPVLKYFNITNSSTFNTTRTVSDKTVKSYGNKGNTTPGASIRQNTTIFAVANWTDNLTRVFEADFQFYNTTSSTWTTINTTKNKVDNNVTPSATSSDGFSNFTYLIPSGHNIFEGKNVSFRIIANDTLGNINRTAQVTNITILVNDTTKPTLSVTIDISGQRAVNNTNISDTTPTIIWNVSDNNRLKYVAVEIDDAGPTGATCNKFVNYTIANGLVESNRNGSITVSSSGTCPLANGTRVVRLTSRDEWGNTELYIHSFTIQTGAPSITFSSLENITSGIFPDGLLPGNLTNNTNLTISPRTALNFTALDGATSTMKDFSWTSSCPANETLSTSVSSFTAANLSYIWPFNFSGCKGTEANHTVNITVADVAGNTVKRTFEFAVDDVGPTITVHSPINGRRFTKNRTEINVSAFDGMSRVESIVYYLDGSVTGISHTTNGTITASQGKNSSKMNISVNLSGTHTIKISVNDTLGNVRNSSIITFTQVGSLGSAQLMNKSLSSYLTKANPPNIFNVSIKKKQSSGTYTVLGTNATHTSETYELFIYTNKSSKGNQINITLTDINASGANWDKLNFSVSLNDTNVEDNIQTNWTNAIEHIVHFNSSLKNFLSNNNDYYGTVLLPVNTSGGKEIWWFSNESDLRTRTNLSACSGGFSAATTTACFNFTAGGKTLVLVPHFSDVVVVNDTIASKITVNSPSTPQTVTGVSPNITVSNDATKCQYKLNITDSTKVSGQTANVSSSVNAATIGSTRFCLFSEVRFKNGVHNISWNVTDSNSNINTSASTRFIMNDTTAPGTSGSISTSVSTTSATVSVTGNETINVTVNYGKINTTLGSKAHETDFTKSQTVTISSLTASTTYYYNVSICDFINNCRTNGTFSFKTSAAAASSSSSSSSGGGGGGVGVVSNVKSSKVQVWANIPSGSSVSLKVDKADIAVTKVSVNVNAEVNNVELSVSSLKDKPVTKDAAAQVFQYLQLTSKNIKDEQADKITIGFKVPKTWLDSNNLQSDDISLYRYNNQEWGQLSTKVVSTDATNVNYEADTPGFSFFAIGSGAPPAAGEEAPGEASDEEATVEDGAPTPVERPKPIEGPGKAPIGWIILAIVIVIGIIGYFAYQKKKQGTVYN